MRFFSLILTVMLGATAWAKPQATSPETHALIERWLGAQNAGDFAAYGALYSQDFRGVRRSGARTVEFDRAGWLKDRARMFRKPMTVSIEATREEVTATESIVSFRQTFVSGAFGDRGEKRLVLRRDGGGLLIASEEMRSSERFAPAASPSVSAPPPANVPTRPSRWSTAELEVLRLLYPAFDSATGRIRQSPGASVVQRVQQRARPRSASTAVLIEMAGAESDGQIEVAQLATGAPPRLLARRRLRIALPSASIPAPHEEASESYTGRYELLGEEDYPLSPSEWSVALRARFTLHASDPRDGAVTKERLILLRTPTLKTALELETLDDTSDGECVSGTKVSVGATPRLAGELFELEVTRVVETSRFDGRECRERTRKTVRTLRWNGRAYRTVSRD